MLLSCRLEDETLRYASALLAATAIAAGRRYEGHKRRAYHDYIISYINTITFIREITMLDIEQVISSFDDYIDSTHEEIQICGEEFKPSEVLNAMGVDLYTKKLNRYIDEHYDIISLGSNDHMYIERRNYYD